MVVEAFKKSFPGQYTATLTDVQMPGMNAYVSKPIDTISFKQTVRSILVLKSGETQQGDRLEALK